MDNHAHQQSDPVKQTHAVQASEPPSHLESPSTQQSLEQSPTQPPQTIDAKTEHNAPTTISWRWTTADIATGAVLGVACGLVFWGFTLLYVSVLSPVLGAILPGLASIMHGFWYFSGPLAVLIIRKPGAAIYVNIVGTAVEMVLGNQFALSLVFASAALQGACTEIPFALTRYRRFNLPISMASGAFTALWYGMYLLVVRFQGVSLFSPRGIIHMISELASGVLIAGVLTWFLFQAIARTGALDHLASGRAVRGYQE